MRCSWCVLVAIGVLAPSVGYAEPETLRLRVLSFNTWGLPAPLSNRRAARMSRIGAAIGNLKPDVVLLQEVWLDEDGERLAADLAPFGLTHTRHEAAGFLGSGLLIASRYPIERVSFRPFRLAGRPHHTWHGDFYANKGILAARLKTPIGSVRVADTHLHARYGTDQYEAIQVTQALQAAAHLAPETPPVPMILGGDINSREAGLPFRVLVGAANLTPVPADLRIDWVLFRSGASVSIRPLEVHQVLTKPVDLGDGHVTSLSDHPGVLAILELARQPAGVTPPTWTKVADEARSALGAAIVASWWRTMIFSVLGLALLGLAVVVLRRRSAEDQPRARRKVAAILLVGIGTIFIAIGAIHEPRLRSGLQAGVEALP